MLELPVFQQSSPDEMLYLRLTAEHNDVHNILGRLPVATLHIGIGAPEEIEEREGGTLPKMNRLWDAFGSPFPSYRC